MGCREAVDGQKGGTVVPIGQEEPSFFPADSEWRDGHSVGTTACQMFVIIFNPPSSAVKRQP